MSTTRFSLFASLALLTSTLSAQHWVRLSVHDGPAEGVIPTGVGGIASTHLSAKVAGEYVNYYPQGGQTAASVSEQHELAFQNAGFTTERLDANEFRVKRGPNNTGIRSGAVYFTDDPGLSLDSAVEDDDSIAVPLPDTKDDGVLVALPQDGAPPSSTPGIVDIELVAMSLTGAQPTTVSLVVDPLLPAPLLRDLMQQQLAAQGFLGNRVVVEHPLQPSQLLEVLQIERTAAGDRVFAIEVHFDAASRQRLPALTGAGVTPLFGATEYGTATPGAAAARPWSHVAGTPRVGGTCTVVHELRTGSALTIDALALGSATQPVFGGWLLVDPLSLVLEVGLSDASGAYARTWSVPGDPSLGGFILCSQGVALIPGAQDVFSTGVRLTMRP